MDTQKVIFIDDSSFIASQLCAIKEIIEKEHAQVIALSDAASFFLKTKAVEHISYHEFEQKGMYDDLYSTACVWGRHWYRPQGEDLSLCQGTSCGMVLEWSMIYFFSHLLRIYLILRAIFTQIHPTEIIIITAQNLNSIKDYSMLQNVPLCLYPDIIECVMRQINMSAHVQKRELPYPMARDQRCWIKIGRHIASYMNAGISLCLQARSLLLGRKKKILFFEGFQHFSSLLHAPALAQGERIHLQKKIGLSLLGWLYARGIRVEVLSSKRPATCTPRIFTHYIADPWEHFFLHRAENLFTCLAPFMRFLFTSYLPHIVLPDLIRVDRSLVRICPDTVVVENDTTYFEKMLVMQAKRRGIHTVVIQHGINVYDDVPENTHVVTHDFFPLQADAICVYGQVFQEGFGKMGTALSRVIVTGGARFDGHYQQRRSTQSEGIKPQGIENKKVLIFLQDVWGKEGVVTGHIGLHVHNAHIQQFIRLAQRFPQVQFIIRPHGQYHLWNILYAQELQQAPNCTISREQPLGMLLPSVDVAIGYFSTALIEALIHRIPVISLDLGGYINSMPFWKYGLSTRVCSFEELAHTLPLLLYDASRIQWCKAQMNQYVRLFNYNDEGHATERIAAYLVGTAREPLGR